MTSNKALLQASIAGHSWLDLTSANEYNHLGLIANNDAAYIDEIINMLPDQDITLADQSMCPPEPSSSEEKEDDDVGEQGAEDKEDDGSPWWCIVEVIESIEEEEEKNEEV